MADLIGGARATRLRLPPEGAGALLLVTAERLPEWLALHPHGILDPPIQIPASRSARTWTRSSALVEIVRGRLTIEGPTTTRALAAQLGLTDRDVEDSLLALESEGVVLRGRFTRSATGDGSAPAANRRGDTLRRTAFN